MSDFIATDLTELKALGNRIKQLPTSVSSEGMRDVNEYMINVLQQYPPEKRVTRRAAYPEVQGWFSEKQRKWFFASLRSGSLRLPYRRTQELGKSWKVIGENPVRSIIANESPAAPFVMGDTEQSRMSKLIGWKKISAIVQERLARIVEKFDGGAKRAIRRLRLD